MPNDVRLGVDPTANWGVNDHANDEDDVALDHSSAPAMLLTGPNMGGKSTLLRAMCVAAVLAHAGAMRAVIDGVHGHEVRRRHAKAIGGDGEVALIER